MRSRTYHKRRRHRGGKSRKHRRHQTRKSRGKPRQIRNPSGLSQIYSSVYGPNARGMKGGIQPVLVI